MYEATEIRTEKTRENIKEVKKTLATKDVNCSIHSIINIWLMLTEEKFASTTENIN